MAVLFVILGLASIFYAHCAIQFGRELKRSRARRTSYRSSRADMRHAANAIEIPGRAIVLQMPQPKLKLTSRQTLDPEFGARENLAAAQATLTYRKNRIIALPSETRRLAVKRAAKG